MRRLPRPPRTQLTRIMSVLGTLICSFAAGLFGAFKQPLMVPLVFAVSAALYSVIEYTLYPQYLRAINGTIAELKNVEVWFCGLKRVERRLYKEELVLRTETQLTYEIASIAQLAVRYDKKRSSATGQDDVETISNFQKNRLTRRRDAFYRYSHERAGGLDGRVPPPGEG